MRHPPTGGPRNDPRPPAAGQPPRDRRSGADEGPVRAD